MDMNARLCSGTSIVGALAVGAGLLLAGVRVSFAAEVSVLSAGAVEPALRTFAAAVKASRGDVLAIRFNTAPQIAKRVAAGERFDIVIAPIPVIEQAVKDGKAIAGSSVSLGRVGIGVVVRRDTAAPDISSSDALKRDLVEADTVVYNLASTGLYLENKFAEMGLIDQIKAKTIRYADGAGVVEHVIRGKGNEIGFAAITEIKLFEGKGIRFVGPLPSSMQNFTTYAAVLMSDAIAPDAARRVLKDMAASATKATFVAAGIE
jgi:molybdate transport system substrate-binding protein